MQSVKSESLPKLILFGEASLRRLLAESETQDHGERNHQGTGSVILFPSDDTAAKDGSVDCRERLGGRVKYYHLEAG